MHGTMAITNCEEQADSDTLLVMSDSALCSWSKGRFSNEHFIAVLPAHMAREETHTFIFVVRVAASPFLRT